MRACVHACVRACMCAFERVRTAVTGPMQNNRKTISGKGLGHLQGYLLEFQNLSRLIIFVNSIFKDVSLLGVDCMENDDCLSII